MKSKEEKKVEKTTKKTRFIKEELLETFNEEVVEPINHTRKSLYEEDCLSSL